MSAETPTTYWERRRAGEFERAAEERAQQLELSAPLMTLVESIDDRVHVPIGSDVELAEFVDQEVAEDVGDVAAGLFDAYALLRCELASGTVGGSILATTWTTRPLNSEVFDDAGIVSLIANQFTLDVGTYLIEAQAFGYHGEHRRLRLRNVTAGTTEAIGPSVYASFNGAFSTVTARVVLAAPTTFAVQEWASVEQVDVGLGSPSAEGSVEVYLVVTISREAAA